MTRERIDVWPGEIPDNDRWVDIGPEIDAIDVDGRRRVRNVSRPSLEVFPADPAFANGTAIIVAPGGAFHVLMMDKEGETVAHWLNALGVTVFLLRYRMVPTPPDVAAYEAVLASMLDRRETMREVIPVAIADGLQSVRTVRERAAEFGVAPDRIGIMGFSAGGFVATGAASLYDPAARPDFAVPIYGGWAEMPVPPDGPPLFLAVSSDDTVIDPGQSLEMAAAWRQAGHPVELHLYERGGHGYGLLRQGLPSDEWAGGLRDWLDSRGLLDRPVVPA
ncbi:MAG TPA: alpha/beta hydrolase [Thermomicrobiales bacterium]|nr:alpha/beta hydrolase [Thermomicrobiales bacterium]